MNIALIGYGKMGKEIEKIALERNHNITLVIDVDNISDLKVDNLKKSDVAVDFSTPASAYSNIMKCFEADVPVVCGTTGWLDQYNTAVDICKKEGKTFFYASNFSLGVNILFALNKYLAKIMNRFEGYEVEIREVHHIHKADSPSGTAISIANDIISIIKRKSNWELTSKPDPSTIKVTAVRENEIPGIHMIKYDSNVDTLELSHSAKSRKAFASGALVAAEFIRGKKGFYTMADLLHLD